MKLSTFAPTVAIVALASAARRVDAVRRALTEKLQQTHSIKKTKRSTPYPVTPIANKEEEEDMCTTVTTSSHVFNLFVSRLSRCRELLFHTSAPRPRKVPPEQEPAPRLEPQEPPLEELPLLG